MANQILAGAVFQAGQVIAGIDADNILDTFIAPSTGGPDEKYYLITSLLPSDHAVYLYDGSGNELVRIPKPNDTGDYWGRKVVTNGTKIAITDTYYYVSSNVTLGSLYIYDMDGSNMVKVTHSDASTGDYFGNSLKMNSTKIIVGAPYAGPIYRQGAIYVYDLDGTNEVKITTSDAGAYDELTGWNGLDVTESKILAGAAKHGDTTMHGGSGAMYTFDLDGSNEFKFQPSDIDSSDVTQFGSYVAASETKVAVAIIGGVYIFDHDGTNEVKVTGEGSGIGAYGNTGVAINDTHIGVTDRNYSSSRGAFYIYDIDGTNEVRVDAPSSVPTSSGYFGTNLTMTSDKIYTSPLDDNSAGTNSGNVYEYNLDGTGERTLPTPSTFGPNSDFGDGLYVYDSSLIPSPPLPAFIAPSTTSSTVANKILMKTSVSGLLMTDAAFANPLTLSSESPRAVAAGGGKVVSISFFGEINVYDSSTGALETTFTDTLVDHGKTRSSSATAHSCAIGAGKIFINSPEHNSTGVGSIIVVDLLDRNVPSFLITPALGNYSRLGHQSFGKIQFIDGKIHAGTSTFSAADMGIHSFDPDGSNHTFIPTTFAPLCIVKFGDNYAVANEDHGVEIISPTGQVLHSKQIGSYGFGRDIDVTSTNKLVVRRQISQYDQAVYIYDEGFTNEIIISQGDQPNTSGGTTPADALWLSEARENSGGLQTINGDILVTATKASSDTVNESGAIYRYNDSGVLQEIFYGTVAGQRLGTDITVGTETTTTTLPAFIAPPVPPTPARWVVVGARKDDDNGENSGSVYVYDANNLSAQPTKLTPFDGAAGDTFGHLVTATADKIMVGCPQRDDNVPTSGSVYVYDANNLSAQPTKLTPFDGASDDRFGASIASTNDKIFVAAWKDDDKGRESGSVYIYDANDLTAQPTKLTSFDGVRYDYFGISVAVTSDKILVGAYGDDDNGSNSGSVYVYDANDLTATPTKLTAFDGASGDFFGLSIAATADKIAVGAFFDDDNGDNSGSVYVYDANDLTATPTKLTAFDGASGDYFGQAVAATADKIFVCAARDDDNGDDSGSVYVYDANDLSAQPTKLTAFDGDAGDRFGHKIGCISDKIVVSAYGDDDNGNDSGSVYVYDANDLSATPTKLTAFDGAAGDIFGQSIAIG